METGKRCILTLSFLFTFVVYSHAHALPIKFATFNIKWYGLGSLYDEISANQRDYYIRKFLDEELFDADVILFEEIVDVNRLRSQIMKGKMNCITYKTPSEKHQHVVLCHKKSLRFDREPDDNNYEIDKVAYNKGRMRPALSGVLKTSSGKPLAHVIGVHLKANPEETRRRLQQTHDIADRISEFEDNLPVVILGDFNTHVKELTGWHKDDYLLLDEVFKDYNLDLRLVKHSFKYTFRNSDGGHRLDHIWVSKSATQKGSAKVASICQTQSKSAVKTYNEHVSDHCPLSATFDLLTN